MGQACRRCGAWWISGQWDAKGCKNARNAPAQPVMGQAGAFRLPR
jgi:hypothetical protein